MFIDDKIIDIFRRSTNLTEEQFIVIMREYSLTIMESISHAGLDYLVEKENIPTFTPTQLKEAITRVFDEIKHNKEMLKRVNDDIDRINGEMIKNFRKNAMPGDALYLKVYLATKVQEMRHKTSQKSKSLNLLNPHRSEISNNRIKSSF